jgi:hypothetical protein
MGAGDGAGGVSCCSNWSISSNNLTHLPLPLYYYHWW